MIVSLSKRTAARFLIASEQALGVHVHWMDRSYMCGGDGCVACKYQTPRVTWFVAATMGRQLQTIEICQSLMTSIFAKMSSFSITSTKGVIVTVKRATVRAQWTWEHFDHRPELASVVSTDFVANAVAALYRLPPPVCGETAEHWLRKSKILHQSVLSRYYLFEKAGSE